MNNQNDQNQTIKITTPLFKYLSARRREASAVNPALRRVHFHEQLAKLHFLDRKAHDVFARTLVDALDGGRKDARLKVRRRGQQEHVVRVPVDVEDGRLVLLDVLRHPPVVVLLKVADRHNLGARRNRKLVLVRRPLAVCRGAVDAQNDKRRLPVALLERPHVRIAILRAGHKAVGLRSPVDASDTLIVLDSF